MSKRSWAACCPQRVNPAAEHGAVGDYKRSPQAFGGWVVGNAAVCGCGVALVLGVAQVRSNGELLTGGLRQLGAGASRLVGAWLRGAAYPVLRRTQLVRVKQRERKAAGSLRIGLKIVHQLSDDVVGEADASG